MIISISVSSVFICPAKYTRIIGKVRSDSENYDVNMPIIIKGAPVSDAPFINKNNLL